MTADDIGKLLTYGQMALEQGWYDQARQHFEQALALDADNREAIEGLTQVDEALKLKAFFESPGIPPVRPAQPAKPASKVNSVLEWIGKKREERARDIARQREEIAKREEEKAKEIAEVKQAWAEERARRGNVPLQLGQCPECGKIDSYRKKDDSGCIATGILLIFVVGGFLTIVMGMEICVGSGILIFLLLLVELLLPDNFHCRFCGAVWRP